MIFENVMIAAITKAIYYCLSQCVYTGSFSSSRCSFSIFISDLLQRSFKSVVLMIVCIPRAFRIRTLSYIYEKWSKFLVLSKVLLVCVFLSSVKISSLFIFEELFSSNLSFIGLSNISTVSSNSKIASCQFSPRFYLILIFLFDICYNIFYYIQLKYFQL